MKVLKSFTVLALLVACLIFSGSTNAKAEVVVYDADGQFLGILIDIGDFGDVVIYMPSLDITARLSPGSGDVVDRRLFFFSDDCSDTPHTNALASYVVFKNGDKYYIGDNITPMTGDLKTYSLRYENGDCYITNNPYVGHSNLVSVQEFDLQQLQFDIPVALPMKFEHEPAQPGKWKK